MFLILYRLIWLLFTPITFLLLLIRSRKDIRYRYRFKERLGFLDREFSEQNQGAVVVHCASVGEAEAAKLFIQHVLTQYPKVLVTCTTPTGSERIHKLFGESVGHCYLPLDNWSSVKRWLNRLQPKAVILMETELWPSLLMQCRDANIATFLVNARLSKKSAKSYRRFYGFTKLILNNLDAIICQNDTTKKRFKALGFSNPIESYGNFKFDLPSDKNTFKPALTQSLKQRKLIVAGSTHAGEDEHLIDAFAKLATEFPELLLVLVPRHPERFDRVTELVQNSQQPYERLSQIQTVAKSTKVVIGDTMGDLKNWYALARFVFIGGSLIPRGGHNPIEAMLFGKPIVTGRYIFNFQQVYQQLEQQNGVAFVENSSQIASQFSHWINNPQEAKRQGDVGKQIVAQNSGATHKAINFILTQLGEELPIQRFSNTPQEKLLYCSTCLEKNTINHAFSIDYWQSLNQVVGHSTGRNVAWFIEHQHQQMVLRHYYRGGLIGKLLNDQFLSQPAIKSRAFQEFKLLTWMRAQNLPVPKACGARFYQRGLFYQADILVKLIANSQDLYKTLCQTRLSKHQWEAIGDTIAKFHQKGIFHSDLNCHNILLDDAKKVWLIDFDKCARKPGQDWKPKNLARLKRSLEKEVQKQSNFFFNPSDWQSLLKGYSTRVTQPLQRQTFKNTL